MFTEKSNSQGGEFTKDRYRGGIALKRGLDSLEIYAGAWQEREVGEGGGFEGGDIPMHTMVIWYGSKRWKMLNRVPWIVCFCIIFPFNKFVITFLFRENCLNLNALSPNVSLKIIIKRIKCLIQHKDKVPHTHTQYLNKKEADVLCNNKVSTWPYHALFSIWRYDASFVAIEGKGSYASQHVQWPFITLIITVCIIILLEWI